MILIEGLGKVYGAGRPGAVTALDGVDLAVPDGAIQGVVGPSGSGKSTLLRCLNLLEVPSSGRIVVDGSDLTALSATDLRAARRRIGTVFQHFELLRSRTVAENIALPLELGGLDRGAIRARVGELVDLVGLRGRESKFPSQLSGGQQQRVGVARALAANPAVLLCDEPTSALDPATMNQILDLLVDVNRELGVTIVLITHELAAVRRICTHAALLDHGRIVESGPVAGLVTDPGSQLGTLISPLPDGVFDRPAAALVTATGEVTGQPWLATIMAATGFAPSIVGGGVEVIGGTTVGRIVVEFAPDADRAIIDAEVARHPDVELTWLDSVDRGSPPAGVADAGADALAVAADAGAVAR